MASLRPLALALAALLASAEAQATNVSFSMGGEITSSTIPGLLGTRWGLTISYPPDASPFLETPEVAFYSFVLEDFHLDSPDAPEHFQALTPTVILIENGQSRDALLIEAERYVPPAVVLSVRLTDPQAQVFDATSLPLSLAELAFFESAEFVLEDALGNEVRGVILSHLIVVPEPGSLASVLSGLFLLAAKARRRIP